MEHHVFDEMEKQRILDKMQELEKRKHTLNEMEYV
jgi:hypothetical protein